MDTDSTHIVKRGGQRPSEQFDRTKLHASVLAACLSVRTPEGEAETTARNVCEKVLTWLETKPEVTSNDLRRVATEALTTFHPEAAYLYKHHRLVI
jgi:transcriptional regulator NrdR family protein